MHARIHHTYVYPWMYGCVDASYATWEREKFCLQYCALICLKHKIVIKYCAPIHQNWILKVMKGFALGFFSMEQRSWLSRRKKRKRRLLHRIVQHQLFFNWNCMLSPHVEVLRKMWRSRPLHKIVYVGSFLTWNCILSPHWRWWGEWGGGDSLSHDTILCKAGAELYKSK